MQALLLELFRYNEAANAQLFSALVDFHGPSFQLQKLSSHILNAQALWLDRITGDRPRCTPWALRSLGSLATDNEQLHRETHALIDRHEEDFLNKMVAYTTSEGEPCESHVRDILLHVQHHATYHRAQVAQLLKQFGGTPPATDYILYKRAGFNHH